MEDRAQYKNLQKYKYKLNYETHPKTLKDNRPFPPNFHQPPKPPQNGLKTVPNPQNPKLPHTIHKNLPNIPQTIPLAHIL